MQADIHRLEVEVSSLQSQLSAAISSKERYKKELLRALLQIEELKKREEERREKRRELREVVRDEELALEREQHQLRELRTRIEGLQREASEVEKASRRSSFDGSEERNGEGSQQHFEASMRPLPPEKETEAHTQSQEAVERSESSEIESSPVYELKKQRAELLESGLYTAEDDVIRELHLAIEGLEVTSSLPASNP